MEAAGGPYFSEVETGSQISLDAPRELV